MKAAWVGLLAWVLFSCSSCIYIEDGHTMARYEKEVSLSAPLEPGSSFSVEIDDGSIAVEGLDVNECKGTAKIVVHARTEEQAQELGEQIEVGLEPSGKGLKLVTRKPLVIKNAYFSVSPTVNVPVRTNLTLTTNDGSMRIANIKGNVDARTADGGIEAEGTKGDLRLRTSDGNITCGRLEAAMLDAHANDGSVRLTDVTAVYCTAMTLDGGITLMNVRADSISARTNDGAITCRNIAAAAADCQTSDGSVDIEYARDAPNALKATAITSDGNITFAGPPGLSAVIEASTQDGTIHTELPITVRGKVGKSLNGTIGGGEGKVYLKTSDGSITIR